MNFGRPNNKGSLKITNDLIEEIVVEFRMTLDLTPEKIALMDAEKRVPKELSPEVRKAKVKGVVDETLRHLHNGDLSEEGILRKLARLDLKRLGFEDDDSMKRGRVEGFEI